LITGAFGAFLSVLAVDTAIRHVAGIALLPRGVELKGLPPWIAVVFFAFSAALLFSVWKFRSRLYTNPIAGELIVRFGYFAMSTQRYTMSNVSAVARRRIRGGGWNLELQYCDDRSEKILITPLFRSQAVELSETLGRMLRVPVTEIG